MMRRCRSSSIALLFLAQRLGEATGEVYQMRDVRTCSGFEKAYAKCDGLPACAKACEQKDCMFASWDEWYDAGGCSGLCFRHRRIEVENNECGTPCAGPQIESKGCPKKECMLDSQDCSLSLWADWSACTSATDQRFRSRSVLGMPSGNGSPCSAHLNETAPCDQRRPIDCEFSEWGLWTSCSATCDSGYRATIRRVMRNAAHGGRPCEGTVRKTEPCGQEPCEGRSQDCEVGSWSQWQGCDFSSPQQRYRTREVVKQVLGGGKACSEVMRETTGCALDEPQDCSFSDWSAWSECDKSCGGGQTYRKRVLASEPTHGGTCVEQADLTETMSCNINACSAPKACALMPWGEWGACSASCDVGVRERSRELLYGEAMRRRLSDFTHYSHTLVEAQAATVDCSGGFSGGLKEVAPCSSVSCARQHCAWGEWTAWSDCTCTCGGGTRERSRVVKTQPEVGGNPCLPEDKRELGTCATQPCDVCIDGEWGEWSNWTACSASCGQGYRSRHRDVQKHPNHCGKPVMGVEDDYAPCMSELKHCEMDQDCQLTAWTGWTACSCKCFGVSERSRNVLTFPSGNGKQCSGLPLKEQDMCNPRRGEAPPPECAQADMPSACQLAVWGDWGACSATCGSGQRLRMRSILSPAAQNGELCNGTLSETKPCESEACQMDCQDCIYSDWGAWGECSKCGGQRYRHRHIQQMANKCGKPCTLEDVKETGQCTSSCEVEQWCAWTEWSEYGQCSSQCGPATRSRERVLVIHAEQPAQPLFKGYMGITCEGMQLDSTACEYKSCTQECEPVHCDMGEWTEWSEPSCNQLCERTRVIKRQNSCGGKACDGALEETKSCPMECQKTQDCMFSEWGAWSECSTPDAQKFRKRQIVQEAVLNGRSCEGHLTETQYCSSPGLPVPCELSTWGSWSDCTKSCLGGLKQRTRAVRITASNGGEPCQGGLEELTTCNVGHCSSDLQDCSVGAWEPWSQCSQDGQRSRVRTVTPPQGGGRACEAALHELQECSRAIDCKLSEWSGWDVCDKTCEGGQQTRHRQVIENPRLGGAACEPGLIETRGCMQEPCDQIDCVVSEWGKWGDCTTSCGTGQRKRERKIEQQPRNGGMGCGLELSQLDACSNEPCEYVDCLWSEWTVWSACTCSCGGGQFTRTRRVEQVPQPGGKPCVPLSKEEVGVCNAHPCDVNACVDGEWGEWEAWSSCSATCKGGVTWRARPVKTEANECGKPVSGPMRESARCNDEYSCEKTVDCVFGDWEAWSDCTSNCNGVMRRSRSILVHGRGEGKYCLGAMKETSPCNPGPGMPMPQACLGPQATDCVTAAWAEWSPCSASCDGGSRTRERVITTVPSHGGAPCEDVLAEVEGCGRAPCEAECQPQDCVWEDWGDWSACDKCGGERKRFRHITKEASCGGSLCKALSTEETSNCTRQCHDPVYCMWGEWKEWSACSATCGEGAEKVRMRQLELTTAASMPLLEEFDISAGVDEALLQDSVNSLEEHTRNLRTRRLQNLYIAFASGGVALLCGLLVPGVATRFSSSRRGRGSFKRLPLDSLE